MRNLFLLAVLSVATSAFAQITISTFSALPGGANFTTGGSWSSPDQLTVSSGVLTVGVVGAGNPTDSGYLGFADLAVTAPIAGSQLLSLTVTARIDAGNASPGFSVNLFDDQGLGALTATFATSSFVSGSFTSVTATLSAHPENGTLSTISSFGIAGSGTSSAFRMSFDSVVANVIPEPSTYAAIIGALALGLAAYRRRQQQLAA